MGFGIVIPTQSLPTTVDIPASGATAGALVAISPSNCDSIILAPQILMRWTWAGTASSAVANFTTTGAAYGLLPAGTPPYAISAFKKKSDNLYYESTTTAGAGTLMLSWWKERVP